MTKTQILPSLLILIDFASAVVYATGGDWRKVGYWAAAGVLTICVTY